MADVTISQLPVVAAPTPGFLLPTSNSSGTTTSKISVENLLYNAFGSRTTSGVLNWNDVSNTKPGSVNNTLLTGVATNGPGREIYYHPFNLEYNSKDGSGNVTQMAIAYGTHGDDLWMRGRFGGNWSQWTRFLNTSNYSQFVSPVAITGDYNDLTNKPNNAGFAKAWIRIGNLNNAPTAAGSNLNNYIETSYNVTSLTRQLYNSSHTYLRMNFTNSIASTCCGVGTAYGNANGFCYVAGMSVDSGGATFAITGGVNTGTTHVVIFAT